MIIVFLGSDDNFFLIWISPWISNSLSYVALIDNFWLVYLAEQRLSIWKYTLGFAEQTLKLLDTLTDWKTCFFVCRALTFFLFWIFFVYINTNCFIRVSRLLHKVQPLNQGKQMVDVLPHVKFSIKSVNGCFKMLLFLRAGADVINA